MIYIGIDPGFGGGLAVVLPEEVSLYRTPIAQANGKRQYIPSQMACLLDGYQPSNCVAVLEQVHSLPKEGVSSAFRFGQGLGLWEGILAALKIPYYLVPPARWQKAVLGGQYDPESRRLKAIALYPTSSQELQYKADSGKADALLMANYARLVCQVET